MKRLDVLIEILLWVLVINMAVALGAGLYEAIIEIPQWYSISDGYYTWDNTRALDANVLHNFWTSFALIPLSIQCGLMWVLLWWTKGTVRKWFLAAAMVLLIERGLTLGHYAPTLVALLQNKIPDPEISRAVMNWVQLNYVRQAALVIAFLTTLVTFALVRKGVGSRHKDHQP